MTKSPDITTARGSKRHKQFLSEFDRGDTHAVLAERYGVNRTTIRAWLVAAGVDPSLNVKRRRAKSRKDLMEQVREAAKLQGQRELAMIQLQALADRHGVKPLTLAHWHEGTGHYKPGTKVNLRAGRPRRLPRRRSGPGATLAREVDAACRPWTARWVAGLIRAKPGP